MKVVGHESDRRWIKEAIVICKCKGPTMNRLTDLTFCRQPPTSSSAIEHMHLHHTWKWNVAQKSRHTFWPWRRQLKSKRQKNNSTVWTSCRVIMCGNCVLFVATREASLMKWVVRLLKTDPDIYNRPTMPRHSPQAVYDTSAFWCSVETSRLVVGFIFQPAVRSVTHQVLARFVVDKDDNTKRHRHHPPPPPGRNVKQSCVVHSISHQTRIIKVEWCTCKHS